MKNWTFLVAIASMAVLVGTTSAQHTTDLRDAAAVAMPATVAVQVEDEPNDNWKRARPFPRNGPYQWWVGEQWGGPDVPLRCGFAVNGGRVITLNVPIQSDQATVVLSGGEKLAATVVVRDHVTGLAVLKVQSADSLEPLAIAEQAPPPGSVVAMTWIDDNRHALVEAATVRAAPSSIAAQRGFTQPLGINLDRSVIGAPIVNVKGQLVGVAARSEEGAPICLPTTHVRRIIAAAKAEAPTDLLRGRIGIALGNKDRPEATTITPGLPGEKAGLIAGDLIESINSYPTKSMRDVLAAVAMARGGDEVKMVVRRGDETTEMSITLDEQPVDQDLYALKARPDEPMSVDRQVFKLEDGELVPLDDAQDVLKGAGGALKDFDKLFVPNLNLPKDLQGLQVERSQLEETVRRLEAEKKAQDEKIRALTEELEKLKR